MCLYIYRHDDQREGGGTKPADSQGHTGDQCPQKQDELLQQSDTSPPAILEDHKDEKEAEQDQDKSQLSSSVIIEVPNVQSCLELSTITGTGAVLCGSGTVCMTFLVFGFLRPTSTLLHLLVSYTLFKLQPPEFRQFERR